MGEQSAPRLKRYLPHALAATAAVICLPIGVVSLLVSGGILDSVFVTGPAAMLLSLGTSSAGSAWWKKRRDAHDLVFSDLMIWGWLRRLRTERRISRAVELLGNHVELPTEQQIQYFRELATALEARDPYTHGHTRRVTAHAVAIAKRMGLSQEQVAKVRTAAAIHDIGKLNTPREVLNKPGRLNDQEFTVIRQHPVDGAEMARRLGDEEITAMVLHHHERLDGTGYPNRLAGADIPLGARIIAVADTFDAITSKRPYRASSSHKKGMAILTQEAGTQLDPDAVRAFRSHYSGLRAVAIGSILSSGPGQFLPWRWGLNTAAPLAKSLAAVAAAGILGTASVGLARPVSHSRPHTGLAGRQTTARASHLTFVSSVRPSTPVRSAGTVARRRATHPLARTRTVGRPPASSAPTTHGPGTTASTHSPAQSATAPPSGSSTHGGSASGDRGSPSGGGSSSGGGGSSSGGGSTTSVGPVSVSTSSPSVTATAPSVTATTPSVTLATPVGPVTTPPTGVSTPSVTVSTPSVTLP